MTFSLIKSDFQLTEVDQHRVHENLTELHEKVLDTMAPNTKKAYLTDFGQYLAFCRKQSIPSLASDWRVTKESIEEFFDDYMTKVYTQHNDKEKKPVGEYKHHTIKRKIASIRFFIGITELPDPFKHSKLFTTYVNNKLSKKPSKQAQAPAMTKEVVETITALAMDDSLLMLRDLTIINVAFDTLFRASNLVAIDVSDIDFDQCTILARYSKTDKSGEGHYGYLSQSSIELIKFYLQKAEIVDGYLFRALSPKQTVQPKPLTTRTLWDVYKRLGKYINEKTNYSCHSTRTGAVISMVDNNVPIIEIIKHGGWKSAAMPARYSEQYNARKTGMAKVR